jgi:hypothetical protein
VQRQARRVAAKAPRLPRGARNRDAAGLQRLAQGLERAARELRQLVQEEHPAMRERDLARARRRAPAHQGHRAGGVVGRAHRAAPEGAGIGARTRQPAHGRALQRLLVRQGRQQRGQALSQHGLAGAGRAHEQQAVLPGGGDLERPARACLAPHLAQVGHRPRRRRPGGRPCTGQRQGKRTTLVHFLRWQDQWRPSLGRPGGIRLALGRRQQRLHHLEQVRGRAHVQPRDARGLGGAVGR